MMHRSLALSRFLRCGAALAALMALVALVGCGPNYSPDTYSTAAVQQANKVERGVIVGVRKVDVSSPGTVGAIAGGAAGGALGAQIPGSTLGATFGAIGGTVLGGLVGTTVEHTTADTTAFEYIVRKPNGELVSVTQKDKVALTIGQTVLVIAGNQARIVADYTTPEPSPTPPPATIVVTPLSPPEAAPVPDANPMPSIAIPSGSTTAPARGIMPSSLLPTLAPGLAPGLATEAAKI